MFTFNSWTLINLLQSILHQASLIPDATSPLSICKWIQLNQRPLNKSVCEFLQLRSFFQMVNVTYGRKSEARSHQLTHATRWEVTADSKAAQEIVPSHNPATNMESTPSVGEWIYICALKDRPWERKKRLVTGSQFQ